MDHNCNHICNDNGDWIMGAVTVVVSITARTCDAVLRAASTCTKLLIRPKCLEVAVGKTN